MRISAVVALIGLCMIMAYLPNTAAAKKAVVVSVDRPEGCLRIRSAPSTSAAVVGCAEKGSTLRLTGTWTRSNWAEVRRPVRGWVWGPQIRTRSARRSVVGSAYDTDTTVYRYGYGTTYPYRRHWRRRGPLPPPPVPYGVRVGPRGLGVAVPGVSVGVGRRGGVYFRGW